LPAIPLRRWPYIYCRGNSRSLSSVSSNPAQRKSLIPQRNGRLVSLVPKPQLKAAPTKNQLQSSILAFRYFQNHARSLSPLPKRAWRMTK
jgi:hypothetical protein